MALQDYELHVSKREIDPFAPEFRQKSEEIAYAQHELGDLDPEPLVDTIEWQQSRGMRVARTLRSMGRTPSAQRSERFRRSDDPSVFVGRLQTNAFPNDWKSIAFVEPEAI